MAEERAGFVGAFQCGAAAGLIARVVTAPLDFLKIRAQAHTKAPPRLARSIIAAALQREGILSLWKGNLTAQLMSAGFSAIQFRAYHDLMSLSSHHTDKRSPLRTMVCAGTAGSLATLGTYPFDLMRTRLAVQHSHAKIDRGLVRGVIEIASTHGVRALFTGMPIALMATVPYMAVQFATYESLTESWAAHSSNQTVTAVGEAVSGGLAGACGKLVTVPLDVLKRRQQVYAMVQSHHTHHPSKQSSLELHRQSYGVSQGHTNLRSLAEVARNMARNEPLSAFYRGGAISVCKSALQTSLCFLLYGLCTRLSGSGTLR